MSIFKSKLERKIDKISLKLEALKIDAYVELMSNTKKLIFKNFMAGISKGIGMAIGFTILGAIVVIFLKRIVALNIPIIGKFISDIVAIVETELGK